MLFGKGCCSCHYRGINLQRSTNIFSNQPLRRIFRNFSSLKNYVAGQSGAGNRISDQREHNFSLSPGRPRTFTISDNQISNNTLVFGDIVLNGARDPQNTNPPSICLPESPKDETGSGKKTAPCQEARLEAILDKFPIGRTTTIGILDGFWTGGWGEMKEHKAILTDAQHYNSSGNPIGTVQLTVRIPICQITYVV